jgi:hypothetical protein
MQNHCVNILRLKDRMSADISLIFKDFVKDSKPTPKDQILGDGASLDFQSVIPMPHDLKVSWRPLEEACEDPKQTDKQLQNLEEAIKAQNLEDYGYETPEQWSLENWGTEYNCYDFHVDWANNSLLFDTANTPPLPIVQELAKKTSHNLMLFYCEPAMGIYGEMTAFKTGEALFKDYTEETTPKSFHKEFPKDFPPSKRPNPKKQKTKSHKGLTLD